jgi:hypothetical protein
MIDSLRVDQMAESLQRDALPEIAVMAPRAAGSLESLLGQIRSIRNAIQGATELRSLTLKGRIGEVTTFSPLEHEMVGGNRPGVRTVRVTRPAVEAPGEAGGRRIVRKAIVEPVE